MIAALPRRRFLGLDFGDAPEPLLIDALAPAIGGGPWRVVLMPGLDAVEMLGAEPAFLPLAAGADLLLLASPALRGAALLTGRRPPRGCDPARLWRGLLAAVPAPGLALHVVCADGRPVEAWAGRLGLRRLTIGVPPAGLVEDASVLDRAAEVVLHQRADVTLLALPARAAMRLAARVTEAGGGRGLCLWLGEDLPALADPSPASGLLRGCRELLWNAPRALALVLRSGR